MSAQQTLQKIKQVTLREVDRDINTAHANMFGTSDGNHQLSEALFVSEFLPFFSGKIKDDDRLRLHAHWVGVAGSVTNAVDIIDDGGKTLFTVPPLMSSTFIRTGPKHPTESFHAICRDAKDQSNRLPILGQQVIAERSIQMLNRLVPTVQQSEAEQWNQIFDRYGVARPKGSGTATAAASTADDDSPFDF